MLGIPNGIQRISIKWKNHTVSYRVLRSGVTWRRWTRDVIWCSSASLVTQKCLCEYLMDNILYKHGYSKAFLISGPNLKFPAIERISCQNGHFFWIQIPDIYHHKIIMFSKKSKIVFWVFNDFERKNRFHFFEKC